MTALDPEVLRIFRDWLAGLLDSAGTRTGDRGIFLADPAQADLVVTAGASGGHEHSFGLVITEIGRHG